MGIFDPKQDIDALSLSKALQTSDTAGFKRLGGRNNPLLVQSLLQFENILSRKGATDPARLNQDIRTIQSAGQGAAQDTQGDLARAGLGRSGAGQAIVAAQRVATAGQIGQRQVLETQIQEERERSDIRDFFSMLDRSLAGEQINLQDLMQRRNISLQRQMAMFNAIGGAIGSFI